MAAQTGAALRYEPVEEESSFARDVIAGLTARPKRLPPKYFYDEVGAQLFEQITALPEYYPTRCELELLRERAPDLARFFPVASALIEFGSGSSKKVRILLAGRADHRGVCAGRHFFRDAGPGGGRFAPRLSAACGAAGRSRFHAAVRFAGRGRRHGACRLLPGIDHRKFRAARSLLVPASCRAHAGTRRDPDHRDRPGEGQPHPQRRLQRQSRHHGQVQSQPPRAHQPRARRRLRSCKFQPPCLLQCRASPHRDASGQQEATEGEGVQAGCSNSAPARPSTPRTATSTRWIPSRHWHAGPDGSRSPRGRMRAQISPSMHSCSRIADTSSSCWWAPLPIPRPLISWPHADL